MLKKSSHYKYIMDSLNLNIDTYSNKELARLFTLSENYVREDVIKGKKLLLDQLHKHNGLAHELKTNIEMFIDTAAHKLATIADNFNNSKEGTWAMKHTPLMEGSANNYIIENPNTIAGKNAKIIDGRMGGTDETPPGWLNPINIRTLLVGMNIDSRFRPNYYNSSSSDFTVNLPQVQRKVTNMRIATVEIPMSYYGISKKMGNNTMVITSGYKIPIKIVGNMIENPSGDTFYHPAVMSRTADPSSPDSLPERLTFNKDTPVMQLDNTENPEGATCSDTKTVNDVLVNDSGIPYVSNSNFSTQSFGTGPLEKPVTHSNYATELIADTIPPAVVRGVIIELGWLVTLPEGNYEMDWQGGNNAADITMAMNNAFTSAIPGFLDTRSGIFWCLCQEVCKNGTSCGSAAGCDNIVGYMPYLDYGIRPKIDICYSVDRRNGKSIIAIPSGQSIAPAEYVIQDEKNLIDHFHWNNIDLPQEPDDLHSIEYIDASGNLQSQKVIPGCFKKTGFIVHFPTSSGGSLQFDENIQLFLGWQLGFRAGHYDCTIERACISEGICLPCGPRYMFLSIDDGLKSSGSNFIAAFAESTLDENVMTRINLSNTLDDVGVYKCASDVGLSNQLNRTREYFGPVDISRLRCRLLDEYGRVIDLNNMDWSMSIVFEKLYD